MSGNQPLTSLSLTHVAFDATDPVAYLFAYVTLAPLAILVAYATTVVVRRELAAATMFIGQLACEALNAVLKRLLKEKRPSDDLGDGYGMPSSHAQFVGYFTVYLAVYLYARITFKNNLWKYALVVILFAFAAAVSYSRIYLNYHTPLQVFVGNVFGALFAFTWFALAEFVLRPCGVFTAILDTRIAQYWYVRDSVKVPNVLEFEYVNWRAFEDDRKHSMERAKRE